MIMMIIIILYNNETCPSIHPSVCHCYTRVQSFVLDYGFLEKVTAEWVLCELQSLDKELYRL